MKLRVLLLAVLLAALVLPAPAVRAAPPDPVAPKAPAGWLTVMSEGFEGTFPGAKWTVTDNSNDGYQRYWGKEDFKPHTGSYSAWPASAGANAVDPAKSVYPNNMDTRMVYGPFDLSNALQAQLSFWLWWDIEVENDSMTYYVSADGVTFEPIATWEGQGDWSEITFDLIDYLGDSSVWVRWDFYSDYSVGLGGAFVDDVSISQRVLDAPVVTIKLSGANVTLEWPAVTDAASYEVWWGTNAPYFTPGVSCSAAPNCATVVAPQQSFVHQGASGGTGSNYTYQVRAVTGTARSSESARVGEFDFALDTVGGGARTRLGARDAGQPAGNRGPADRPTGPAGRSRS